jgi:hypothetical protein
MVVFLWAVVDLLQIPLVLAVYVSVRLARPLGRGWKSVAIGFGGYAAWVVLTARAVPYSASGFAVFLFGMLLDPRRETSPRRVWALGSAVALCAFWAVPVALAWWLGRGPRSARKAGAT